MGGMGYPKLLESMEMRHFMDVCQEELIGIEIRIDGDGLDLTVFAVAEIAQLG